MKMQHPKLNARHSPEHGAVLRMLAVSASLCVLALGVRCESASPYRGLWIGQVTLNYANEVSVPLDANNVAVAPDPIIPTPTHDQANLRLILHVSSAGQVTLLKDVAILNRLGGTNVLSTDSDVALVTDEMLYGDFPPQPAVRFASAVFDFGDSKATEAVDAVVEAVAAAVTTSVQTNANLNTQAERVAAENAATQAGVAAAAPVIASADVAVAFAAFLANTNINAAAVDRMADDNTAPATEAYTLALGAASNLLSQSFFQDSRGVQMVLAISNAVQSAADGVETTNLAQNTAASFADIQDNYNRFIAGKQFGDMIAAAAGSAAAAAASNLATLDTISDAVNGNLTVNDARAEAIRIKVTAYRDSRGSNAVEEVVSAIITNAASFLSSTNRDAGMIEASAARAGRDWLAANVPRYPVAMQPPTPNYNEFIRSTSYQTSSATAARAAAAAGVTERRSNQLSTSDSVRREARLAAIVALEDLYAAAARAVRNELPLAGEFGPGLGDPRLTWDAHQTNQMVTLGDAALTGTIYLPASHPTNPFRHRRHPDHTQGFNITRQIRIDFDEAPGGVLPRPGYGVERITGVYREEIFGLHKPLGAQRDVGLRVEGTFRLDRISLIDTLNAR